MLARETFRAGLPRFSVQAVFVALTCFSAPATALTVDLSPLGEAALDYDSNVFRVTDNRAPDPQTPELVPPGPQSEQIRRVGAGLTLELDHGLQRVIVTGVVRRLDYRDLDALDHTAQAVDARWRWGVGRAADGIATYRYERQLDDFEDAQTIEPNLQEERRLGFSGGLNITPRFRLGIDLTQFERRNELAVERRNDLDERTVDGSVSWVSPGRWDAGIGFAYTDGEYVGRNDDNAQNLAREYEDRSFELRLNWFASGISNVSARIGRTQRDLAPVTGRDFSGTTGRLDYQRTISGKTQLSAAVYREVFSVEDVNANFVESDGIELGALWQPTVKTTFELNSRYVNRIFDGQPQGGVVNPVLVPRRSDRERAIALDWRWDAVRWLQVQSGIEWEQRTSNEPDADYDAWLFRLGVQANVD